MARRCLLFALVLVLVAGRARAEVVRLGEIESRALSNPAAFSEARARIAQADAELEALRDARRPTVTLNVDTTVAPGGQLIDVQASDGEHFLVQGSRTLGSPGAFDPQPRYGGIVVVQAGLLDFGRTANRIRAAERRAQSTRTEEGALRGEISRACRRAYLGWTVAYARQRLVEHRVHDEQARVDVLRGWIAAGSKPTADLAAAELEQVDVEMEAAEARGAVARARLDLQQATGVPLDAAATPDLDILEASSSIDEPPGAGFAARALDQQADALVATAEAIERVRAPIVFATAQAGLRGQSSNVFPAYQLGLAIALPLWDGGVAAAHARAARAQADQLRAEARSSLQSYSDEREAARVDLASGDERVRLGEKLRRLAETVARQADERYRLGTADLRALLDADERLAHAEAQALAAKADRAHAALRLGP
jgi:outer membrane protein TolC